MQIAELFHQQLEREVVRSRRALEQVPSGYYEWRPHDKSMTLGYLAELVAIMPRWVGSMVTANELDVAPTSPAPTKKLHTSSELLSALRDAAASARDALMNVTDTQLDETFELKARGDVVIAAPRHEMIVDVFAHLSHHRGQLTVYLRLLDATVPALFGPSADDTRFGLD